MAKTVSVDIKSKFDAEFRRFSINTADVKTYEEFKNFIQKLHRLSDVPFLISYSDPKDGDLLPINNDDNLARALTVKPLLRLILQRKGENLEQINGHNFKPRNLLSTILSSSTPGKSRSHPWISNPQDFRQVSAIIDVDIVPETCRRVRLLKHGSERPLGFYIRDGTSVRVTPSGLEKVPGIFISRLVPGGLAESTGLLAVNDEVLEVNGIEVAGKTLDQVTDMMVANSYNLIITVKPANQRNTLSAPRRGSISRTSRISASSVQSATTTTNTSEEDDHDEIVNFT